MDLLKSYKTYLSFALLERWHKTNNDKKEANSADSGVIQKLASIKMLF